MNPDFEKLRTILSKVASFDESEWDYYRQHVEFVVFEKKDLLTRNGEVEHYVYFILSGIVRHFFVWEEREVCLDFGFEKNLVSSYVSFVSQKPSDISIQALTTVKAFRIHYHHVEAMYAISKRHEHFGRVIAERLFAHRLQREMILLSMSAEEKYRHLLSERPDLIRKIPVKDIASYLGIHPESLSRIRSKIHSAIS